MEDILASIKRIIAEDGEAATQRATQRGPRRGPVAVPPPAAAEPEPVPEPIAATVPPPAEPPPEAAPPPPPAEPADVLELTSPLAAPEPAPAEPAPPAGGILSPSAETASRSAFAALSQLQVRTDPTQANTLEGLVADMLRPMLREWLDRELPAIVERLVAAEVARVSGRT